VPDRVCQPQSIAVLAEKRDRFFALCPRTLAVAQLSFQLSQRPPRVSQLFAVVFAKQLDRRQPVLSGVTQSLVALRPL
jgi:hypothetical protein